MSVRIPRPDTVEIEFPTRGFEQIEFCTGTSARIPALVSRMNGSEIRSFLGHGVLRWTRDDGALIGTWHWHGQRWKTVAGGSKEPKP